MKWFDFLLFWAFPLAVLAIFCSYIGTKSRVSVFTSSQANKAQDIAEPGQFPFIGALFKKSPKPITGDFICAVSFVKNNWALTAAHCLFDGSNQTRPKNGLEVKFYPQSNDMMKAGESRTIEKIEIYPKFNGTDDDLALLKLSSPVPLENPITIVDFEDDEVSGLLIVVGWDVNQVKDTLLKKRISAILPPVKCPARTYADFRHRKICLDQHQNGLPKEFAGGQWIHPNGPKLYGVQEVYRVFNITDTLRETSIVLATRLAFKFYHDWIYETIRS